MRIVAEIPHPKYRISLLHMNNRYVVKIEYLGLEQNYKLRESDQFKTAQDVSQAITAPFLESVHATFEQMVKNKSLLYPHQEIEKLVDGII